MIYTLFVGLIVLTSLLMVGTVLIRELKGGSLTSGFSPSNAIMSARKATDVIERTTWGLVTVIVILSVACTYVALHSASSQSVLGKATMETQTTGPSIAPGFGANQQQAPTASEQAAPATQGTQSAPAAPRAPITPAK